MRPTIASSLFGYIFLHLSTCATADTECWARDGRTQASTSYVPCNNFGISSNGVYSMCCRLNMQAGADSCDSSGLCFRAGTYYRDYCTDRTWKSSNCIDICRDPNSGGSLEGTVELTKCPDGSFCCGATNLTCCGTPEAVTVFPTLGAIVTNTIIATSTATVSMSTSEKKELESELSSANTVRLATTAGLGAALGVVVLCAGGVILFLLRRLRKSRPKRYIDRPESRGSLPRPAPSHNPAPTISSSDGSYGHSYFQSPNQPQTQQQQPQTQQVAQQHYPFSQQEQHQARYQYPSQSHGDMGAKYRAADNALPVRHEADEGRPVIELDTPERMTYR